MAGRLNFHYRRNGAERNRLNIQKILYRETLWQRECVLIGVFTIKEMVIPMCIYWLPCVRSRKIILGEIKRSKTGHLFGIRMEILLLMIHIQIGGRIKRIRRDMVSVFQCWMQMGIRN